MLCITVALDVSTRARGSCAVVGRDQLLAALPQRRAGRQARTRAAQPQMPEAARCTTLCRPHMHTCARKTHSMSPTSWVPVQVRGGAQLPPARAPDVLAACQGRAAREDRAARLRGRLDQLRGGAPETLKLQTAALRWVGGWHEIILHKPVKSSTRAVESASCR